MTGRTSIKWEAFPIWSFQSDVNSGDYISNSYLHWDLSLNLLDLDFNREFQWRWFCFKPFVGLRSGWFRQKFNVEYSQN